MKNIDDKSIAAHIKRIIDEAPDHYDGAVESVDSKINALAIIISDILAALPQDIKQPMAKRWRVKQIVYAKQKKKELPEGTTQHWNPPPKRKRKGSV